MSPNLTRFWSAVKIFWNPEILRTWAILWRNSTRKSRSWILTTIAQNRNFKKTFWNLTLSQTWRRKNISEIREWASLPTRNWNHLFLTRFRLTSQLSILTRKSKKLSTIISSIWKICMTIWFISRIGTKFFTLPAFYQISNPVSKTESKNPSQSRNAPKLPQTCFLQTKVISKRLWSKWKCLKNANPTICR